MWKIYKALRLATMATVGVAAVALAMACGSSNSDKPSGPPPDATGATASSGVTSATDNGGVSVCPPSGAAGSLTGVGSSFINPLMTKLVADYQALCDTKSNYSSIGSGAGIQQITAQTVDFAGSDGIMSDKQEADARAAGGDILHVAITSGAEAVIFNLSGISGGQLRLDGPTLAGIYMGNIKKWNDPKIAALNPAVKLPSSDIAVVHRADGSGTTFIFTNYLSKVSPDWQSKVGYATSVNWPAGAGGAQNDGVAGQVKQLPNSIGYVELAYAIQNKLPWAQIKNQSGAFVEPSIDGVTQAAEGITIPGDMKILITDSNNPKAYPIAGFSWALVYVDQKDAGKGQSVAHFLWWAIHEGQKDAAPLSYGPLSSDVVKAAEAQLLKLQCDGSACLTRSQ
ncbi:MAG TPA: phosphate ABC transporter substrate-binding protein PstS [Dehalococcoidia bacterium]|nr:phosphate ABC transporter substrate-binding protein PstS [Dehalococcoidia bacterium]